MKALVIDAYDSFVYIIYQYLLELGIDIEIVRNDEFSLHEIRRLKPDFIVLGPGPGHPQDSNYIEIIREFENSIPILGICLGHQAIALAYNGTVIKAKNLMHGKSSPIKHDKQGCFKYVPNLVKATRYHSLIVSENNLPECLLVTSHSIDDGYIMGIRHKEFSIESIQFHPESVNTEQGMRYFQNFIDQYVKSEETEENWLFAKFYWYTRFKQEYKSTKPSQHLLGFHISNCQSRKPLDRQFEI